MDQPRSESIQCILQSSCSMNPPDFLLFFFLFFSEYHVVAFATGTIDDPVVTEEEQKGKKQKKISVFPLLAQSLRSRFAVLRLCQGNFPRGKQKIPEVHLESRRTRDLIGKKLSLVVKDSIRVETCCDACIDT